MENIISRIRIIMKFHGFSWYVYKYLMDSWDVYHEIPWGSKLGNPMGIFTWRCPI
jgi:hypothetical protein